MDPAGNLPHTTTVYLSYGPSWQSPPYHHSISQLWTQLAISPTPPQYISAMDPAGNLPRTTTVYLSYGPSWQSPPHCHSISQLWTQLAISPILPQYISAADLCQHPMCVLALSEAAVWGQGDGRVCSPSELAAQLAEPALLQDRTLKTYNKETVQGSKVKVQVQLYLLDPFPGSYVGRSKSTRAWERGYSTYLFIYIYMCVCNVSRAHKNRRLE